MIRGVRIATVIATVVGVLVVGGLGWTAVRASHRPALGARDAGAIADRRAKAAIAKLRAEPPDSVTVYQQVRPELVIIEAQRHAKGRAVPADEETGLGTGVIVNADGQIVTALHVVQGATSVKVTFADGTESPAIVNTADADHDIAVLTTEHEPEVIVPAVLGGGVRVGDEVFAVGHPLGLVGSLSAGVVSGLDRSFELPDGRNQGGLIQFDAAVNPGNSGGPLLNRKGQVIGIVTGLANPAGDDDFVGIGFAVPIRTAGGAAGAPSQ